MHKNTPDDIWIRIDRSGGNNACWLWKGWINPAQGYGYVKWNGRATRVHRLTYELTYGSIPKGIDVLHKCDNPPCVNPAHLFLGTALDNARDRAAKGRNGTKPARHDGIHNPNAILTFEQVEEIRIRYNKERISQSKLAIEYGISQGQVSRIILHKQWPD